MTDLGYSPGPIDGVMGSKTKHAIKKYQENTDETATGDVSDKLVNQLNTPCTQKIVDGVAHQRGACPKPEDLAPGVQMRSGFFQIEGGF